MMVLFFALLGGLAGLWGHYYCTHFATQLATEIHAAYCEIFPQNPPHFHAHQAKFKPLKCSQKWLSFGVFACLFALSGAGLRDPLTALLCATVCTWLIVISIIDWHYQLISPALCQNLLCLGIGAAYFERAPIDLTQSLQSSVLAFVLFFSLFHLAKWYYQQEAFGRGDYWLISALSSFLAWQLLPLFILLSCLYAIAYALISQRHSLPFAPFLTLGWLSTYGLNMLGLTY